MKSLNSPPKFIAYAIWQSITHPTKPIVYNYCNGCGQRFNVNVNKCPKCGVMVGENPERREVSPIPWWGSILIIFLGIVCWIGGGYLNIAGLDEAGHALVYIPLGNIFGLSLRK